MCLGLRFQLRVVAWAEQGVVSDVRDVHVRSLVVLADVDADAVLVVAHDEAVDGRPGVQLVGRHGGRGSRIVPRACAN